MAPVPTQHTSAGDLAQVLSTCAETVHAQLACLTDLCDMLDETVIVTDPAGVILYANAAASDMTGYAKYELLGSTPALWWGGAEEAYFSTLWPTLAEAPAPYRAEVRNTRKDDRRYDAEMQIRPLLDGAGSIRLYVCVERDTTERKQYQRSTRQLITLASHNLKTPLTSMRWYAEMLRDGDVGRLSKDQLEYVEEILGGVRRMVDLIHQWLTLSKIDLGVYQFHNEEFDVSEVVQGVLDEMQGRLEGGHMTARYDPGPQPCRLTADRDVTHTIVRTLVLNAIKYNRPDGSVYIETLLLPPHEEYAGRVFEDERVVLSVRDTGIGIPAEEQGRVFQQFFRASNIEHLQTEGSGLGLFMVQGLVKEFGGVIWFASSPEGSAFHMALPVHGAVQQVDTEELG